MKNSLILKGYFEDQRTPLLLLLKWNFSGGGLETEKVLNSTEDAHVEIMSTFEHSCSRRVRSARIRAVVGSGRSGGSRARSGHIRTGARTRGKVFQLLLGLVPIEKALWPGM